MDTRDTDMMNSSGILPHNHRPTAAATAAVNACSIAADIDTRHPDDVVRELLTSARHLVHQGNPSQALRSVVLAMKTKGGKDAVFQALHRARELYRQKLQANAAVDQLTSLFAECAIAEAEPQISEELYPRDAAYAPATLDVHESSILAETGRGQVVFDAFSDGSSFICLQCGGLVSNHRKDEHFAYWCCQI